MRYRGAMIGLSLFMVVAVALTWLVYVTLRRDVAGQTVPYAAVFSDVFGLREGDDVRMAGVRVGRVEKIELQGDLAKVSFVVQSDQQLLGSTVASVTYQNIVGQRYLGLSLGNIGEPGPLPPGQRDPASSAPTRRSTWVRCSTVIEPLFSVLNPRDADNLTKGVIQSLQGDDAAIVGLVDQTSRLTESFAGRDEQLGEVITDLNVVVGQPRPAQRQPRRGHHPDPGGWCPPSMCAPLRTRRLRWDPSPAWYASCPPSLEVYPSLNELVVREPGFAQHLVGIEPQPAFTGANLPLLLKGFARITNEGAYANAYACDLKFTGFFPGLNDVIPIIVDAATPGAGPNTRRGAGIWPMADRTANRNRTRTRRRRPLESRNKRGSAPPPSPWSRY